VAKNDVYNSNFGAPTFESLTRGVGKTGVDADYRNDGPDYNDTPQITFYGNVVPPDIDQPDTISPSLEIIDPTPDTYLGLGDEGGSHLVFLITFNEQLLNFEMTGNWAVSGAGAAGMLVDNIVLSTGPTSAGKWIYGVYVSHGSFTEGGLTLSINPASADPASTIRDAFENIVATESFNWFIDTTRPAVDAMTPDPDTQPLLIPGVNWGDGSTLVWFDLNWSEYIPNTASENIARYTMRLKDISGNILETLVPLTASTLSSSIPTFSDDGALVTRVKFTTPSQLSQATVVELEINNTDQILDRAGNDMLAVSTLYSWAVDSQAPTWSIPDATCITTTPPMQLSPGVVVGPRFIEVEFDESLESVEGQGPIYDPANWIITGMAANSPQAVSVSSVVRTTAFGVSPSGYQVNLTSSGNISATEYGPMTVSLINVADVSGNPFVGAPLSFAHRRVLDVNGADTGTEFPTPAYSPGAAAPNGWDNVITATFSGAVQPMTPARAMAAWDFDFPAGVSLSSVVQVSGTYGVTAHQMHFTWGAFSGVGVVKVRPAGLNLAWDGDGPEGIRAKVGCPGSGGRPLSNDANYWEDPATYWHEVAIDNTGPTILSWSPAPGSTADVSFGSPSAESITVQFDKSIQQNVSVSVSTSLASGSSIVALPPTYIPYGSTGETQALVIPFSAFTVEAGDSFTVSLSNVMDLSSNPLEGSGASGWSIADTDAPYIMTTAVAVTTVNVSTGEVELPIVSSAAWSLDFTSIPSGKVGVQGVAIAWNETLPGSPAAFDNVFNPANWEVKMGSVGASFPSDCVIEIIPSDGVANTPDGIWDNPSGQPAGYSPAQWIFLRCVDQNGVPRIITAAVAAEGVSIKPLTSIVDHAGNPVAGGHALQLLSCTAPEVAPSAVTLNVTLGDPENTVVAAFSDPDSVQVADHYKLFSWTAATNTWAFLTNYYTPATGLLHTGLDWGTTYSFKIVSYNASESIQVESNIVTLGTGVEPVVYYSPGSIDSAAQPLSPESYGASGGWISASAFNASGDFISPPAIADLAPIVTQTGFYGASATLRSDASGRWIFALAVTPSAEEITAKAAMGSTTPSHASELEIWGGWSAASHVEYTYFDLDDVGDTNGFLVDSGTGLLLPNRPTHTVSLTKDDGSWATATGSNGAKIGHLVFPNPDSESDWNSVFTTSTPNFGVAISGNDRVSWLPPLAPSTRYVVAFRTVHMDGAAAGGKQYSDWMIFTGSSGAGVHAVDYAGSGWSNHIDIIQGTGSFSGIGAESKLVSLAPFLPTSPASDAPTLTLEGSSSLKVSFPHAPATGMMGLIPTTDADFFKVELFKDGNLRVTSDVVFNGPSHASPTGAVVEQSFGINLEDINDVGNWVARVSVRNWAGTLSTGTSESTTASLGGMSNEVITEQVFVSTPFYVGITAHDAAGYTQAYSSVDTTASVLSSDFAGIIRYTFFNDYNNASPTTVGVPAAAAGWWDYYTVRVADAVLGVEGYPSVALPSWRALTSVEQSAVGFIGDAWYHQFDFTTLKQHGRWIQIVIHGENGDVILPSSDMLPTSLPTSAHWVGESTGAGARHCLEATTGGGMQDGQAVGDHWFNIIWHTNGPVVLDADFSTDPNAPAEQGAAVFRHVWHAEDSALQTEMAVNEGSSSQGWIVARKYAEGGPVPSWGWFRGFDQHDWKNWYDAITGGSIGNAVWGTITDDSKTPAYGNINGWVSQGATALTSNIVTSFWAVTDYPLQGASEQGETRFAYGVGSGLVSKFHPGEVYMTDPNTGLEVTARSQGWMLEAHGLVLAESYGGKGLLQVIITDEGGSPSIPVWESGLLGVSPPLKIVIYNVESTFGNTTSEFQFLNFRVVDLVRAHLNTSGNTFPWTIAADPADWKSKVFCNITFSSN
jgi:hypothetical protein